jgi:serine/threonine protein kinase
MLIDFSISHNTLQGAYGTVIAARDTKTNQIVAIKQVCNAFDSVVDGKRLLREIKLGTFLRHRNICTVIDIMRTPPGTAVSTTSSVNEEAKVDVSQAAGEATTSGKISDQASATGAVDSEDAFNDVYLVMDLMESDLQKIIYSAQPLSEEHIQYLMFQLLSAIKYLQSANVIHRDIKPSNVLVNSACELRLCDFGLARGIDELEEEEMTRYVVTR